MLLTILIVLLVVGILYGYSPVGVGVRPYTPYGGGLILIIIILLLFFYHGWR